jgi:hypothetical protein
LIDCLVVAQQIAGAQLDASRQWIVASPRHTLFIVTA